MSLDFSLDETPIHTCSACGHVEDEGESREVFSANITHNLAKMFYDAGVYGILWRGTGMRVRDVLPDLEVALELMRSDPARFRKHESPNGWGTYDNAIPWFEAVVAACRMHPNAVIDSRC